MKTRILIIGAAVLLAASPAFAGHAGHARGHGQAHDRVEYARVLRVDPIVHRVAVYAPARTCREACAARRGGVAGPMIAGGIIGGVIGHGIGDGRDAAVLLGTLIGASLAHDAAHRSARAGYGPARDECCRAATHKRVQEYVDGYRVTYRHRGEIRTTRLPYDPGAQVRVRIDVR